LSTPLVYIVGGKNFAEAIPLFRYFLPGIVFYSIPMVLATQWNIVGIFRQVNIVSLLVLLASVMCNIILVPAWGITGGAVTFLIIAIMAFCIHIWFVQRILGHTPLSEIILIKARDIKTLLADRKKSA